MKTFLYVLSLLVANALSAQSDYENIITKYHDSLSETYQNANTSILSKEQLISFEGLKFYEIDSSFRVSATLKKTPTAIPFNMQLSSGLTREYVMYGMANFNLKGSMHTLPIYQNTYYKAHPDEKYGNSLFLPFTDLTSGNGSYGGGRYIDLVLEDIVHDLLIIDFNKAYNPYCAYITGYNCPIPPEENDLHIFIRAGVKDFEGSY